MSRDALLYVADIVAAGEAILRYTDGVSFEALAANDERRAAVERSSSQSFDRCSTTPTQTPDTRGIGRQDRHSASRKAITLPVRFAGGLTDFRRHSADALHRTSAPIESMGRVLLVKKLKVAVRREYSDYKAFSVTTLAGLPPR